MNETRLKIVADSFAKPKAQHKLNGEYAQDYVVTIDTDEIRATIC